MNDEQFIDLHFPVGGVDISQAFSRQPNRPVADGVYGRTCVIGNNVRGFEATTLRRRGGSRSGLRRYVPVAVVAGSIIQELAVVVLDSPAAKA